MSRRSEGGKVVASTVKARQMLIICEKEGAKKQEATSRSRVPRFTLGREHLALQGMPVAEIAGLLSTNPDFTEAFLGDLAGIAASTPVFMAILLATMASVVWRLPDDDTAAADGTEAAEGVYCQGLLTERL